MIIDQTLRWRHYDLLLPLPRCWARTVGALASVRQPARPAILHIFAY